MKKRVFLLAVLAASGAAYGQAYNNGTGFEDPPYIGSAAGTVLTAQDGWTLPSGADQNVYTYAGNALGLPQNLTGGLQFMGQAVATASVFRRGQHLQPFSLAQYSIGYDLAAAWSGTGTAAINLSSFSLQDSVTSRSFIALNNFITPATPTDGWKAEYNVYDAAGVATNNQSAGAAWANLALNHWYRQSVVIDFATNAFVSVSITDLTTNTTTTANPAWFLQGGAASTLPVPTGLRCFEGGSIGDTMGWDNISISLIPAPSAAGLLMLGLGAGSRRRR